MIALLLWATALFAQRKIIRGNVLDASQIPLAGVTVASKLQTVSTNTEGRFEIEAETGDSLNISYVGLKTQVIPITAAINDMSVTMLASAGALSEVVVTGYQSQRKADLTGAVSVVNVNQIKDIPLGNPLKALQGRVPGVFITSNGAPSGGATVRIRGIGTLGNNDPLYVIDGIPTKRGLEELNQNDIESIQVLKDASSATIYGSRAANGVIIVTTKKGRRGYSHIDVNASTSLEFYNTRLGTLNAAQRGEMYWRASVNDRTNPNNNQIYQFDWNGNFDNPVLNKVIYPEFIDAAKTMRPADTYWYDEIARTSVIQSYNLSFANGGERGNSLFSLSYYDNKGVVKETFSNRITGRFNTDYTFFDGRLKVGENLSATYIRGSLIPVGDVLFTALVQQPIVPVHTISGGWGGPAPGMTDRQNPVRLIQDNTQNKNHFFRIFGNAFADYTVLPNLSLRTSFGVDYSTAYQRTLRRSYTSGFLSDPSNLVRSSQVYDGNWLWQNTITYNLKLQPHSLEVLAGHELIEYVNQDFTGSRQGYALENIDYAYLNAGSTNLNNGGGGTGYALQSFFGKVNYAFNDRYLASVTVRRDGSSRFGSANRYGTFPAFSLGWRLSQEEFIRNNLPQISDLKLRYGWGRNGNQEIANNATYSLYSAIYATEHIGDVDRGTAYDISGRGTGQLPSGFVRIQQGNDSLRWESTTQSNFGIDFGLFDNRLSGSVDYFVKKTSDILISPPYLGVIGEGGNRWFNGASMENKGVEVLLSYVTAVAKDVELSVTGNFSTFRNRITKLPGEVLTAYPGNGQDKTILDRSITSIFGFVADGIFTSQAEVDKHAAQPGKGPGRIRYRDLNSDGTVDNSDRDFIGHRDPDFLYGLNVGLNYKNLSSACFGRVLKERMYITITKPTLTSLLSGRARIGATER